MEQTFMGLLNELIGHRVRVETSDGSIRRGVLSNVTGRNMRLADHACEYPMMIWFDQSDIEGMDFRAIVSIGVEE